MKTIKVKTPAKINLTLEVLNKREDGFHNIQSIMQAISLYDFLTFTIEESKDFKIELYGDSNEIPYNESNLIYKAAVIFFEKINKKNLKLTVNIEKNIPVAAGLAGGSSDAAGTIYALNKLYDNVLNNDEVNNLCSKLGSDINFCLKGGCCLCTQRGEVIRELPVYEQSLALIKPKNIGISAKEAYTNFSKLKDKSNPDNTSKLVKLLQKGKFDKTLLYNSLEKALFPFHKELSEIKNKVKGSLMSGSGSAFFVLNPYIEWDDKSDYVIFEKLTTIKTGVLEV